MMPPSEQELNAADLWAQITAMPKPYRVVPFPRKGPDGNPIGEIAMVVLSQEESMAAKASSEKKVRQLLRDAEGGHREGYEALAEMRDAQELLFRACKKKVDISKPFFPTVEAIGKLTTDEVSVLVMHYRRVQMELGPVVSEMGQEEMDAWIEKLAKGGSLYPFDSLSLGQQSRLITYMASRLCSSPTGNSSLGPQPDENT